MRNRRREDYVELREQGPNVQQPAENNNEPRDEIHGECCSPCCAPCCCIWTYYIAVFTAWPQEIAKYITGYQGDFRNKLLSFWQWVCVLLRIALVLVGLIAQGLSCFRRDRLDKDLVQETNSSKSVECHEPLQVLSAFIIPDITIVILLFYISFYRCCSCCSCCSCCWDPFNPGELLNQIPPLRRPGKYWSIFWSIVFPFIYVVFSQGVSVFNMYAFDIVDFEDSMVVDWKLFQFSGRTRRALIMLSFLGFIAFDLFYIELIMKYAFRCQMNIYYVNKIIGRVSLTNQDNRYANQNDALEDVAKADEFFKQLNESSTFVGFIIVIIALQAINCIISLLNSENSWMQTGALAVRLIQWITLPLITIYQAAKTNDISKKLRETGLPMYRIPVQFGALGNIHNRIIARHTCPIPLKAKLFGFTIHPWFFYVVVILILFSLMVGSFEWFERVHIL